MAIAYSLYQYIYPDIHNYLDIPGDSRIRFCVPCGTNDEGYALFLVFPVNAEESEFEEIMIDLSSWANALT